MLYFKAENWKMYNCPLKNLSTIGKNYKFNTNERKKIDQGLILLYFYQGIIEKVGRAVFQPDATSSNIKF